MQTDPAIILARGWIEEAKKKKRGREGAEEADDEIDHLIELTDHCLEDPVFAADTIWQIFELTDDPWVLGYLGSGPLETMLAHSPELVLPRLEEMATTDKREALLIALSLVWRNTISDENWRRLKVLVNGADY